MSVDGSQKDECGASQWQIGEQRCARSKRETRCKNPRSEGFYDQTYSGLMASQLYPKTSGEALRARGFAHVRWGGRGKDKGPKAQRSKEKRSTGVPQQRRFAMAKEEEGEGA